MARFSTSSNPQGRLDMYEAVQTVGANNAGSCQNLPLLGVNTCNSVNWVAGAQSRLIDSLVEPFAGTNAEVFATFDYNNSVQATVDVCFSPGGRSYIRPAANGAFSIFNGVQKVKVNRIVNSVTLGLERQIFLLPSGATRVETVVLP